MKILILILALFGCLSCNQSEDDLSNDNVWICKPETGVTITLIFSEKDTMYVSTSLQDLKAMSLYLFNDGEQFAVEGDTLRYIYPEGIASHEGFYQTMISPNV